MNVLRSLLLAALAVGLPGQQGSAAPAAQGPRCLALLVGVTEYPWLRKAFAARGQLGEYESRIRLQGPANDVVRMREVLQSAFGANPGDLATLADAAGPGRSPTRQNVIHGLQELARKAAKDDLVVVFLAGHGAQIPDLDGPADEPDGLDEVFLPSDTEVWDDRTKTVRGALLDDELGPLLAAIRAAGARVWLIVDSCHAGTMMRGGAAVDVDRALGAMDLGLPAALPGAGESTWPRSDRQPPLDILGSGVTAFYAVQPTQLAVETEIPVGAGTRSGVFTWFLTEQLYRVGPGATFEELHQRIVNCLYQSGRGHLMPMLEGEGAVTMMAGAPAGMRLQLRRESGRLLVDGGALHGLGKGDVLDVFAAGKRGEPSALLGRVRVEDVRANLAEVLPTKVGGVPEAQLPAGDAMLPVQIGETGMKLRQVSLHLVDAEGASMPIAKIPAAPCQDAAVLQRAKWVAERGDADYLVHRDGAEWVVSSCKDSTEARHRVDDDGFANLVHRLFRARSLLAIASSSIGSLPSGVKCDVEVSVADGPWVPLRAGQEVRPGSRARLVATNRGGAPVDVRVYGLQSDLTMVQLLPYRLGADALLAPGKDARTSFAFNDSTLGAEKLVVIVSPPNTRHLDALAQELVVVRSASRGERPRGLLAEVLGEGAVLRGAEAEGDDCAGLAMIPYRIEWGAQVQAPANEVKPASWSAVVRDKLQRRAFAGGSMAASADKARSLDLVYQRVAPAVVVIHAGDGHGTGFLVDAERGLVLTNHHVIADAKRFSPRGRWMHQLIFGDLDSNGFMRIGRSDVMAEVLHHDEARDLALLQIQGDLAWLAERPVIKVEPNPIKPAAACVIVGHPSSGMLWSIRSGVVSALGSWPTDHISNIVRLVGLTGEERSAAAAELAQESPRRVLLSTCGANPGDSGGPLVDQDGKLIAVTFAVPSDRMDKGFTYHVAIEEVVAFLPEALDPAKTRSAQVPQAWFLPTHLQWQPPTEDGDHGVLHIVGQRQQVGFLDFDGDSKLGDVAAREVVAAMSAGGAGILDFEMAVASRPGLLSAFYDRDDDGVFDLVLVDNDGDRRADLEFRRDATTDTWEILEQTGLPALQIRHLGGKFSDKKSVMYKQASRVLQGILK